MYIQSVSQESAETIVVLRVLISEKISLSLAIYSFILLVVERKKN